MGFSMHRRAGIRKGVFFRAHGGSSKEIFKVDIFKTILASVVIDHLQKLFENSNEKENRPILYLYIDENDPTTQTLTNLLGSFVKQLVQCPLPKRNLDELREVY